MKKAQQRKNFPHKILLHCLWNFLKHWLKNGGKIYAAQEFLQTGSESKEGRKILDKESQEKI